MTKPRALWAVQVRPPWYGIQGAPSRKHDVGILIDPVSYTERMEQLIKKTNSVNYSSQTNGRSVVQICMA